MKIKLLTFIIMFTVVCLMGFFGIKTAYAQKNTYFNSYYVGINGGIAQATPNGLSSTSGGTINLSIGKNFNLNNFIIGGEAMLGYANNGSWTDNNFDEYGDNAILSVHSWYYAVALKAGYAIKNIMPFIKLGYIEYKYNGNISYSGQYSSYYYYLNAPTSIFINANGLLYGIGLEYMINKNWGLTAQYFGTLLNASGEVHMNNYTIGLSYNF